MKRCIPLILMLLLVFTPIFASATSVIEDQYSDAPGNPTQNNVLDIVAQAMLMKDGVYIAEEKPLHFNLVQILPTTLTVSKLAEIFDFVNITQNPPARYFPEEVQEEIRAIIEPHDVDIDALYMPEFMSLIPQVFTKEAEVDVEMLLDMTYEPGRLVVVVLGWETAEGIEWKALDAEVPKDNTIHYVIPNEVLEKINGQETLFALLTIKPGNGRDAWYEPSASSEFIPSKSASNMTSIVDSGAAGGEGIPEDCRIILVEQNHVIKGELRLIEEHVIEKELPIMSFFDTQVNYQTHLLFPEEVKNDELIAYEIACVRVVNYREPYGDVAARFTFITPYEEEQPMASLLGLVDEEGNFVWLPLHTQLEKGETHVEITFSATILPTMMEETGLLLVLSTPLSE